MKRSPGEERGPEHAGAPAAGGAPRRAGAPGPLNPEEFSERFGSAWRVLWLVAAGVLGRRADVDDVLQEAAVIALGKLNEFDRTTNFVAWMAVIVRNVARNHARKRARRHTGPTDPRVLDGEVAAAGREAAPPFDDHGRFPPDQGTFDDRLVRALNSLEETPRICILLRTVRGLPYGEISAMLGMPEGTVMSHVHRARHALRRRLSGAGAPDGRGA